MQTVCKGGDQMTYTLDQIEKACREATAGPFHLGSIDDTWYVCDDEDTHIPVMMAQRCKEDAVFHKVARAALPELVQRVRDLERERDGLQARLDDAPEVEIERGGVPRMGLTHMNLTQWPDSLLEMAHGSRQRFRLVKVEVER